ncbi:hypothetical protein KDM41_10275 [bacterium]|nr:hypothetical protein [bacterium]
MNQTVQTAKRTCRLLYYGPANAGKRANLRMIHRSIPPGQRLALASEDPERQIAFEVSHGEGNTWQVLVQAVDSGKERFRSAGMSTQPPFDGIVFVVKSSAAALDQSLASFESLKAYLDSWDLDLMGVPVVVQYNGRDEPDTLRVDRLESLLNPWGLLSFPANAAKGEGVRESLKAVLGLAVNHLESQPDRQYDGRESFMETEQAAPPAPSEPAAPPETVEDLGIDYGPPVPGAEHGRAPDIGATTRALSDAIYEELRPPVIVPVKVPRRLLAGSGPVRLLLEVEVVDDDG